MNSPNRLSSDYDGRRKVGQYEYKQQRPPGTFAEDPVVAKGFLGLTSEIGIDVYILRALESTYTESSQIEWAEIDMWQTRDQDWA